MRYYIATRLANAKAHNELRDKLAEMGHLITYDWTLHGPVFQEGVARLREVASAEVAAVRDADVVIVLITEATGGRGMYAEMGAALALRKPVIAFAPMGVPAFEANEEALCFLHHPLVTQVRGLGPLLATVDTLDDIRARKIRSAVAE